MRLQKCIPPRIFAVVILVFLTAAIAAAQVPDWQDPAVIAQNKESAHCKFIPYPDVAAALTCARDASPFHKSLNGKWKFNCAPKLPDRPQENGNKSDVRWAATTAGHQMRARIPSTRSRRNRAATASVSDPTHLPWATSKPSSGAG